MKRGSQAGRISKAQSLRFCRRNQKRSRCAFENPLSVYSGPGATLRPRRVPAACLPSAQADAACLLRAPSGHAPFSKSAAVALLVFEYPMGSGWRSLPGAGFQKRSRCAFEIAADPDASQIPPSGAVFQKRSHCAFADESKSAAVALLKISTPENPKAQPLRFCRRPAA